MANQYVKQLKDMGYTVNLVREGYEGNLPGEPNGEKEDGTPKFKKGEKISSPDIYSISGFGITNLMLVDDDTDSWKRLVNSEVHSHRELVQSGESDSSALMQSDLNAQVSLGNMTKKQADTFLAEVTSNE